jgi:phage terminase large subunit-like protein
LQGRECYAGLDLASTRDVTALVLVFPDEDGGFDVLPYFWVPELTMRARVTRDRVPYDQWARDGFLKTTPGDVCDYDVIREQIRELAEMFDIREIAYDRWGATQLVTQLQSDGANCAPLGQGFASMSAPTKELEKLIVSGHVRHGGHPVLRWMAGNVAVEQDAAGNLKPSKKKSTEKIDGIVALVMALDRASRQEHGSVYDSAEVFTL